jgi:hypothetical protein
MGEGGCKTESMSDMSSRASPSLTDSHGGIERTLQVTDNVRAAVADPRSLEADTGRVTAEGDAPPGALAPEGGATAIASQARPRDPSGDFSWGSC